MPGMDGFELIREVKKINSTLPILVVTSYENDELFDELSRLSCPYLGKPCDPDELLKKCRIAHEQLITDKEVE